MGYRLFLIIAFLCCVATYGKGDDFNLNCKRISVQDGLSGNTINEMVQDGDGYVWMATNNGLSRYDGYSSVNFTSLSSNPSQHLDTHVGRIVVDPLRNLLWMRTVTFMNVCYDLKKARFADWTGIGDELRQLNKFFFSPERGMYFFGYAFGLRHSVCDNGRFVVDDYNTKNGKLPSNEVLMLLEDTLHNIWITTDKGVVRLAPDEQVQTLLANRHIVDAATCDGHTYFLSNEGEAFVLDGKGQQVLASRIPASVGAIGKVNISFVWQGRWMLFTPEATYSMGIEDGIWRVENGEAAISNGLNQGQLADYHFVANENGRLLIFPKQGSVRAMNLIPNARFSNSVGRKFHIADDHEGRLYIASYGNGLFVWNPKTDQLRHFTSEDQNPIIRSNYLTSIMSDHQGCIWIGSEATGAYCLSITNGSTASNVLPEPEHKGDWANAVSRVAERNDGIILIGTREGGVYEYDPTKEKITKKASYQSSVTAFFIDNSQQLWVGTNGEGLLVGQQQYNKTSKTHPLPENKIRDICQDAKGRIWIATLDGGLLMTRPAQENSTNPMQFAQFMHSEMNESRIHDIELDTQGMLWIATNNGIYRLDTKKEHIDGNSFKCYNSTNGRFPANEIFTLHYAKADSTLWVGAAGTGVARCRFSADGERLNTQFVTTHEGLANNNVYSLIEDRYGYLWAGTEEGISRINTRNNIVNTYHPSPVLQGNVATENCALQTHDGRLFFGTNYGLTSIMPEPDKQVTGSLDARITDVKVNGQSVPIVGQLSFNHDQNTLSFFFSSFNYSNIQSSLYQYYLEGLEPGWQPMTTENHADYPQLPPGHYQFHVRSLGNDNEWQNDAVISVRICHPWYATWWARMAWLLLALLFAWYVYRNWKEKFDLHQQMELERQLNDFRLRFFTNITHEFRTPLAIIKGAVDKLEGDRATVQTARRGTKRLLKLVNQFMEFRKASTGNLRLQVTEDNIIGFVKDIYQDFWPVSQQKDIQMTFVPFAKSHRLLFDHQIVETIVYNLLSNAIKYTPEQGSVQVRIRKSESCPEQLLIEVEDSGPGISAKQQEALFQPFMQGLASQGGMGIGLYTARQMAQTHHGTLTYTALPVTTGQQPDNGECAGSLFTFSMPADKDAYSAEEISSEPATATAERRQNEQADAVIRQMMPEALNNDVTVAIIEDDPDMMEQLRMELGTYFHIESFTNGRQGFEGVSRLCPSLLVCDVMLPDMNGYEIVSRLRKEAPTSRLPIIMLTALNDETHQLKAYEAGADDYMVKPCNFRLLVARTMQLVKWYALSTPPAPAAKPYQEISTTQADKVFRDKLAMYTSQHLGEENFNVDMLAEMMQMGRTKFYGKVKELTGLSPNKYLMQQRMERAADLLADGELTVSEVSYRIGIQDPSYFNKCFKAHFGVTPSKYERKASS